MAKKKKITDFLPTLERPECSALQANVEKSIYIAAKKKMKQQGFTWDQLMTACLKAYLSDDSSEV